MRYLWTEDTGAGLHFWKLVSQLFFDNELVVESKGSNQGLLDSLIDLETEDGDEYFVAFDYVVDNQDIRNKYRNVIKKAGAAYEQERFIIQGIEDAPKQKEDFWNTINGNKVNINLLTDDDVKIVEDGSISLIVIHVPRADFNMRPVYVGENPYKGTYKRNQRAMTIK